jgi:uncharacterized membrane protein
MGTNKLLVALLLLLLLIGLCQSAFYYPQLPDRVANNFDIDGHPNGYSSKLSHIVLMTGIQCAMVILPIGFGLTSRLLPTQIINLPNRNYWLAPERKDESLRKIVTALYIVAVVTQIFLISIHQLVIMENLGKNGMQGFWWFFSAYMAFMIGFVIWISIRFRLPAGVRQSIQDKETSNQN